MISVAAHTGSTTARPATAAAISVATASTANRPAALMKPAPFPACRADSWNSHCASRISSRTNRDVCPESWDNSSPIGASAVGRDSGSIVPS